MEGRKGERAASMGVKDGGKGAIGSIVKAEGSKRRMKCDAAWRQGMPWWRERISEGEGRPWHCAGFC